ncbi:MAG: hypothetical protein KGL39_49315 [Patescibacteria group bacterium]|nr:hypothetical protein [Patescibacteria group bacterium]
MRYGQNASKKPITPPIIRFRDKKTHCKNGHPFIDGRCAICDRNRYRAWYESTKSEWLPLFNANRREKRAELKQQMKGKDNAK